jgi:Autographiviridae endonuclease VII
MTDAATNPAWHKSPERRMRAKLRKFGLTQQEYDARLSEQGGVCAICRQPETRLNNATGSYGGEQKTKSLALDHDRRTNTARGILCQDCNLAVGLLKEDPSIAESLATYLRRWNG